MRFHLVGVPRALFLVLLAASTTSARAQTVVPWPPEGGTTLRSGQHVSFEGVTITTPLESDWASQEVRGRFWDLYVITKRPDSNDPRATLSEVLLRVRLFPQATPDSATALLDNFFAELPSHLENSNGLTVSADSSRGALCRNYHVQSMYKRRESDGPHTIDLAVLLADGLFAKKIKVLETERGTVCVHPSDPTRVVNVALNQRSGAGETATTVDSEAAPTLANVRFDSLDHSSRSSIAMSGMPQGVAFGAGAIWVGALADNSIFRLDPGSGRTVAKIHVNSPVGIVASPEAIWTAEVDGNKVARIDPATNTVASEIKVGKRPLYLAYGEGSIWVANSDATISRIDPRTNAVAASLHLATPASAILVAWGRVFVACPTGRTLSVIDPNTNQISKQSFLATSDPISILAARGSLWILYREHGVLARVDSATLRPLGSVTLDMDAAGLAALDSILYVGGGADGLVQRVSLGTGQPIGRPIPVGRTGFFIAVSDDALWAPTTDGLVTRVDLRSLAP